MYQFLPETAHFGEIAAVFHIAPLTAAVAARVEKKPVAVAAFALPDSGQIRGRKSFGGGFGDLPEHLVERRFALNPFKNEFAFAFSVSGRFAL